MEISQVLKAMSHPIRLQMVELLLQRRMCVRSLARHFEVSEPTISQESRPYHRRKEKLLYALSCHPGKYRRTCTIFRGLVCNPGSGTAMQQEVRLLSL